VVFWVMAPYSLVSELHILEARMASYCLHLQGCTSVLMMEAAYYAQILSCCSQILNAFIVEVIMNLWGGSKLNRVGTFFCVCVFCSNFQGLPRSPSVLHERVRLALEWVQFMAWGTCRRQKPHLETYAASKLLGMPRTAFIFSENMRLESRASG
jgi:hypothetical protein